MPASNRRPAQGLRERAQEQPQGQAQGTGKEVTRFDGFASVAAHYGRPAVLNDVMRGLPVPMQTKEHAERLLHVLLTEVRRLPLLAQCDRESFTSSLLTSSHLGLEPGVNGECWILPFFNDKRGHHEATLILGYQGMIKLFYQHPLAKTITAEAVYPEDEFDFQMGTDPYLRHRPKPRGQGSSPWCWYALATTTSGGTAFVVLYPEDIERARMRSKAKNSPAWRNDYDAMAKKTCIRRLFRFLPKSTQLATALAYEDQHELPPAGGTPALPASTDTGQQQPAAVQSAGDEPLAESDGQEPAEQEQETPAGVDDLWREIAALYSDRPQDLQTDWLEWSRGLAPESATADDLRRYIDHLRRIETRLAEAGEGEPTDD